MNEFRMNLTQTKTVYESYGPLYDTLNLFFIKSNSHYVKKSGQNILQKEELFCFQHKSVSHKGLKQHDRFFISGWTIPLRPCQLPLVSILSFSSTSIHSCNRPSADSQVFCFQFLLPLHILIVYLSCLTISCLIHARSSPLSLWRGGM